MAGTIQKLHKYKFGIQMHPYYGVQYSDGYWNKQFLVLSCYSQKNPLYIKMKYIQFSHKFKNYIAKIMVCKIPY